MLFSKIEITDGVLDTNNDSYPLIPGTTFTVSRPFKATGFGIAVLLSTYGIAFHNLLRPEEIAIIAGCAAALAIAGNTIGHLSLIHLHLRHANQSVAVWGTYRHLNRVRRQVAESANGARSKSNTEGDKS